MKVETYEMFSILKYNIYIMEAFIGTAFLSSALKDIYTSIKTTVSHDNDSLNELYKKTDILAKLQLTESLIQFIENKKANPVMEIACKQLHESIVSINDFIEDINDDLINHNASRFTLFGPRIYNKLKMLENSISTFDSRTSFLLSIKVNFI